ncbi:hypothetical protein GGR58DRAFT_507493 [Xylaria digitata]|nr:hypothetical protein GGR58DRAFT_507493 [Xylaria digitata]
MPNTSLIELSVLLALSTINVTAVLVFAAIAILGRKFGSNLLGSRVTAILWISRLTLQSGVTVTATMLYCAVIIPKRSHAVFTFGIIVNVVTEWIRQVELFGPTLGVPLTRMRFIPGLLALSYIGSLTLDLFLLLGQWPEIVLIVVCILHWLSIAAVVPTYRLFYHHTPIPWLWVAGNILGATALFGGLGLNSLGCRLLLYAVFSAFEISFGVATIMAKYQNSTTTMLLNSQPHSDNNIEMLSESQSKPGSRFSVDSERPSSRWNSWKAIVEEALESFGPEFIKLATSVWETQVAVLAQAPVKIQDGLTKTGLRPERETGLYDLRQSRDMDLIDLLDLVDLLDPTDHTDHELSDVFIRLISFVYIILVSPTVSSHSFSLIP